MKTPKTREKMRTAAKQPKQTTLDNLPKVKQKEPELKKQITITEVSTETEENELALKVGFKLLPSKTAFSNITSNLWFDNQQISHISICIPQSPLATNDFELNPVLDMTGISAGPHIVKVEMYEPWGPEDKLAYASKEITVDYVPLTREAKLIKIPTVKHIAGEDLTIVSEAERDIYREIEEAEKRERDSKRDEW